MLFYQKGTFDITANCDLIDLLTTVHNIVECGSVLPLHACKQLHGVHYLNDEVRMSTILLLGHVQYKLP